MKKVLKIVGWLLVLGVLLLIASYNDHDNAAACAFSVYVMLFLLYCSKIRPYKNWVQMAEYDEFYKKFTEQYNPESFIVYGILGLMIISKFFNAWGFIVYLIVSEAYDLWDRRYITTNIKQDLILGKLEKLEK